MIADLATLNSHWSEEVFGSPPPTNIWEHIAHIGSTLLGQQRTPVDKNQLSILSLFFLRTEHMKLAHAS